MQDETAADLAAQATELMPALRSIVGAVHMAADLKHVDGVAKNIELAALRMFPGKRLSGHGD